MSNRVQHRFFIRPLNGQQAIVEATIRDTLGPEVALRTGEDGHLLKPTSVESRERNYIVPSRWFSGEVVTIDAPSAAQWFWLDADIPFNGPLAMALAKTLYQHPGVTCVAEDNTRGAAYEKAEAWIINDEHYLLQVV